MEEMLSWLASGPNLVFVVPLISGLVLITSDLALGGLTDVEFDVDLDADVDLDVDADMDVEGGAGLGTSMLGMLGVGRVPITLLLEMLAVSFGSVGLLLNGLATDLVGGGWFTLPATVLIAALLAVLFTRWCGELFARLMPTHSTTSRPASAFVGELGTTASRVNGSTGQVRLNPEGGRPAVLIHARRAEPGADIPRGVPVLVVDYDAAKHVYAVSPTQEVT